MPPAFHLCNYHPWQGPASILCHRWTDGQEAAVFAVIGFVFGIFAMAWAAMFALVAVAGIGLFVALFIPFLILGIVFRLGFLLFKIVALVMFVGFLGWLL